MDFTSRVRPLLWTFFEAEGESIDAVASASVAPGTFSLSCDFEATLGLRGTFVLPGAEATLTATGGTSTSGGADPKPLPGTASRASESGGCVCTLINHTSTAASSLAELALMLALWGRRHTPASGSRRQRGV